MKLQREAQILEVKVQQQARKQEECVQHEARELSTLRILDLQAELVELRKELNQMKRMRIEQEQKAQEQELQEQEAARNDGPQWRGSLFKGVARNNRQYVPPGTRGPSKCCLLLQARRSARSS